MKINVVVPASVPLTSSFLSTLQTRIQDAAAQLSKPGKIKLICVHETGHHHYFCLLGQSFNFSEDRFKIIGPTITYDDGDWDFTPSATATPFKNMIKNFSDDLLFKLAKAAVAGGVFAREIGKASSDEDAGDAKDRRKFHEQYREILINRGQPSLLESQLWQQASHEVTRDLVGPLFADSLIRAESFENSNFDEPNDLEPRFFDSIDELYELN